MKTNKRQTGVTLIEVATTLSMIAILMAFGAPSYSQFVTKKTVSGAANLVATFVEDINMKSIKRNEFVTISFKKSTSGSDWCIGAVMGKDLACDCMAETQQCLIDSVPTVLSSETYTKFDDLELAFDNAKLSFDPVRGILTDPEDSVSVQIKHKTEEFLVKVSVNATGSVRKCSPTDEKLLGYPICI